MASKASALLLALTAASLSTSGRRGRGLASAAGAAAAAAMATEATTANGTASATSPDPLPPPSYAHPGPCPGPPLVLRGSLITSSTGDRLAMTLTLPGGPGGPGRQAPWPVVAFFNGFQARASFYRPYATHLASWGFATLQYDARPLAMPPDAVELGWLGDAVAWAASNAPPGSPLDTDGALFAAGHSRGGKLAALHAAGVERHLEAYAQALKAAEAEEEGGQRRGRRVGGGGGDAAAAAAPSTPPPAPPPPPPRVRGAFLLDAIDNTRFAPESPAYPSGARALGGAVPVGLAAAGVVGGCNPPEAATLATFWPAAGPGSWLALLPGAGHAEFLDAGPVLNRVFDLLCRRGDGNAAEGHGRAATICAAATALVAWMDGQARGGGGVRPPTAAAPPPAPPLVSVALRLDRDGAVRVAVSPSAAAPDPAPTSSPPPPPVIAAGRARALVANFLAWARAEAASRPAALVFAVKEEAPAAVAQAGNVLPFRWAGVGAGATADA